MTLHHVRGNPSAAKLALQALTKDTQTPVHCASSASPPHPPPHPPHTTNTTLHTHTTNCNTCNTHTFWLVQAEFPLQEDVLGDSLPRQFFQGLHEGTKFVQRLQRTHHKPAEISWFIPAARVPGASLQCPVPEDRCDETQTCLWEGAPARSSLTGPDPRTPWASPLAPSSRHRLWRGLFSQP